MKFYLFSFISLFCSIAHAQIFTVESLCTISDDLSENSGLTLVEGRLITHNDSGGDPFLYEMDPESGVVTRTVVVANASNTDWEDLCHDDNFIYIGDFGNNFGSRTDLRIYKIAITDYLETPNDTVYADTIAYSYTDQTDFEPTLYTTNYDAEALIAMEDELYLFSKNWSNMKSRIYAIPKESGSYAVAPIDSFNTEGLITGAAYDSDLEQLLLTGYTATSSDFLFFVKGFSASNLSGEVIVRSSVSLEGSPQIEGTVALGDHQFYVSSEERLGAPGKLHLITVSETVNLEENNLTSGAVFPNPFISQTTLTYPEGSTTAKLYTIDGRFIHQQTSANLDLTGQPDGLYYLVFTGKRGDVIRTEKLVKHTP